MSTKTILIVDNDLGFVFWLGHILDNAGHCALPSRDAADAMLLLADLPENPDLLIIDPILPGASILISTLRARNAALTVIGLGQHGSNPLDIVEGVDYWHPVNFRLDKTAGVVWLNVIANLLPDGLSSRAFGAGCN